MRVALLSDAHLAGPADPNQQRLLAFLAALEVDRLCLLGDVFQHWWHWGDRPFPAYAEVVDALARFRLSFVPGNHDFHAMQFWAARGAEVGTTLDVEWDGLRVHLAHGDEVDRSIGYRAISAVLRGRPFASVLDAMGPDRAWRLLGRLAGHGVRRPDLIAAQRTLASERLRGRDLVVFGHTHEPVFERVGDGIYVNVGDWVTHHTWLLVEDGAPVLQRHPLE